jgi:outer membrane protein assembly factor BamB
MITPPILAVIPTVLVGGPLTVLSMLFPGVFAGLILWFRRWLAAFAVLSTNSSFYLTHAWLTASFARSWWSSRVLLWTVMGGVALLGAYWSCCRQRAATDEAALSGPSRGEWIMLWTLALISLAVIGYGVVHDRPLLAADQRSVLVIGLGAWAGLYHLLLVSPRGTTVVRGIGLSSEAVTLGVMGLASILLSVMVCIAEARSQGTLSVAWTFEPPGEGSICSSPLIAGERVYTAVAHHGVFSSRGALYCLDRSTGQPQWRFDDSGRMKSVLSSPCIWQDRLYIGEGFHQDSGCKLYCVDAASGHKLWEFATQGHTESSPCVVGDRVYFGAGDDGLYCLDAGNGKEVWHFPGVHVDAKPAVVNDRLYAGSGYGKLEVFCLDARSGALVWRLPVEFSAFASPRVDGERVFFGIGNGNLVASITESPAGALLCVEARSGRELWRYAVPDGVHAQALVSGRDVYFASRDHHCYCLDAASGRLRWKRDLGSPIVTAPVPATAGRDGLKSRLYVAAGGGMIWSLDPSTGLPQGMHDLSTEANGQAQILSTPAVVIDQGELGQRWRLYVGCGLGAFPMTPVLYCLDD